MRGGVLWDQAFPDHRGQKQQHDNCALTEEGKARWVDRAKEFLKLVPKPKAKAQAKTPSLACPRLANVHDLQGWDHAWQITLDFGLQVFVASSPCVPLPEGTRRFWVSVDTLPPALRDAAAGRVRRACLELADKSTRFEVVWNARRPILHVRMDMGSVGWPAKHAAFLGWHMRGSWAFGPAHRRWNDVSDKTPSFSASTI